MQILLYIYNSTSEVSVYLDDCQFNLNLAYFIVGIMQAGQTRIKEGQVLSVSIMNYVLRKMIILCNACNTTGPFNLFKINNLPLKWHSVHVHFH